MTHQTVSSFSTIGYREMSIKALKKNQKKANPKQNKKPNQKTTTKKKKTTKAKPIKQKGAAGPNSHESPCLITN